MKAWLLLAVALLVGLSSTAQACTAPPPQPSGQHYLWTFALPNGNVTVDSGIDTGIHGGGRYVCQNMMSSYSPGADPPQPRVEAGRFVRANGLLYDIEDRVAYEQEATWSTTAAAEGWLMGGLGDAVAAADLASRTVTVHPVTDPDLSQGRVEVLAPGPEPLAVVQRRAYDDPAARTLSVLDAAAGTWTNPMQATLTWDAFPVVAASGWVVFRGYTEEGYVYWGLALGEAALHGPFPGPLASRFRIAGDSVLLAHEGEAWTLGLTDGRVSPSAPWQEETPPAPPATQSTGAPLDPRAGWHIVDIPEYTHYVSGTPAPPNTSTSSRSISGSGSASQTPTFATTSSAGSATAAAAGLVAALVLLGATVQVRRKLPPG